MGLKKLLKKVDKFVDPVGSKLRSKGEAMLKPKAPGAAPVDPAKAALQARVQARMGGAGRAATPRAAPALKPTAPRGPSPYVPVQAKSQGFGRKK